MESADDVLSNLDVIQKNVNNSNCAADIASVKYVHKKIYEYTSNSEGSEKETKMMVKCLNILHDSVLLMPKKSSDADYLRIVVGSLLNCILINDLYRMVDAVILELVEDIQTFEAVSNEMDAYLDSNEISDEVKSRIRNLFTKMSKKCGYWGNEKSESSYVVPGGKTPTLDFMLKPKPTSNRTDQSDTPSTPRLLYISFLPQSLSEEWALAKNANEVAVVLESVILLYDSLDDLERKESSRDISSIVKQTISTLRFETTNVIVNSLKLLEALANDHAHEFVPELGTLFPRIQCYLDDNKVAIRHHALKLGGALVVRLSFDLVGRFIFAAMECKPSHPDISLKLAALSLLSISPSHSMASNPLLSRIMITAAEYLESPGAKFNSGGLAAEVAKDTIALALMTLCFSSQHTHSSDKKDYENMEDLLPSKLSGILGIPPQSALSREICRRGRSSDFPSLRQESYVQSLATIAMEASLAHQPSSSNLFTNEDNSKVSSSAQPHQKHKKPQMSINIPEFSMTPIKSVSSQSDNITPGNQLRFSHDSDAGLSGLPPVDSYQPSWTPKDMNNSIEGPSPWAQPSNNFPSSPITTPLDRSKLKTIKKTRKPGSRLRARTADEALQDDTSVANEMGRMPATAGNDSVCGLSGVESGAAVSNSGRKTDSPLTPVDVGFYSADSRSIRNDQLQQQQQLQTIKINGRRSSRAKVSSDVISNDQNESFLGSRGYKKMGTLEFSSDSDDEGLPNRITEPNSLKENSHLDENSYSMSTNGANEVKQVKVFSSNRFKKKAHVDDNNDNTDMSVQGSSYPTVAQGRGSGHEQQKEASNHTLSSGAHNFDSNHSNAEVGSNQSETPSSQDSFDYLKREELQPCAKPLKDIARVVKDILTADWPDIFHLLNVARRIFVNHPTEVISSGHLHAIAQGLNKQVHNLRSAAAKNSILAIGDMFFGLRNKADSEVMSLTTALLKRCADSSVFISQSIDDCIYTMIRSTSSHRSLAALLTGVDNKSQTIRGKVTHYLVDLVQCMSEELKECKELDMLLQKLTKLTQDSSPDARTHSRDIIRLLISNNIVARDHLESVVSPDVVQKSMNPKTSPKASYLSSPMHRSQRFGSTPRASALGNSGKVKVPSLNNTSPYQENEKHSSSSTSVHSNGSSSSLQRSSEKLPSQENNGNLVVAGVSPRGNAKGKNSVAKSGIASRQSNKAVKESKAMSQNEQQSFPELVELPLLLLALTNKNWQERRKAVAELTDHILTNFEILQAAEKVTLCMERLLELLEDSSVKVVQHAINCVKKIHTEHSFILAGIPTTSLPAVINVSSSANKQIRAQGAQLLKLVLKASPLHAVPQQLVSLALHDKDRLKAESFRAMCIYIHIMHNNEIENQNVSDDERFHIMKGIFFPAAVQMLCYSSSKPEVRTSAAEVLRSIQDKASEAIEMWTDQPHQQNEVRRVLG